MHKLELKALQDKQSLRGPQIGFCILIAGSESKGGSELFVVKEFDSL